MFIKTLKRNQNKKTHELKSCIRDTGLKNIFNPSIVEKNKKIFITFRAYNDKKIKPFNSFYLIKDGKKTTLFNLTELVKPFGVNIVADPKLIAMKKSVYVTFNTGYIKEGNQLYLMKLYPQIGFPKLCVFRHRNKIEKNWGFFLSSQNKIRAVYSLNPLVILEVEKEEYKKLEFVEIYTSNNSFKNYTIGTQPVIYNNKLHLIGHKKIFINKKRLYIGKLVIININKNFDIKFNSNYFVHSLRSLFGTKVKHNKNLISCTYFSSLSKTSKGLMLGYGINDVDFNIAEIKNNAY